MNMIHAISSTEVGIEWHYGKTNWDTWCSIIEDNKMRL